MSRVIAGETHAVRPAGALVAEFQRNPVLQFRVLAFLLLRHTVVLRPVPILPLPLSRG